MLICSARWRFCSSKRSSCALFLSFSVYDEMKNMAISPKRINAEYVTEVSSYAEIIVVMTVKLRFVPHGNIAPASSPRGTNGMKMWNVCLRNDRLHLLFRNEILLDRSVELYGIAVE